ncbi:MAG: FtsX-like permease family protein [Polyangia bacterium]
MRRPFLSALVLGMVTLTSITIIWLATIGYSLRTALIQKSLPDRVFVTSEGATEDIESQIPANILSSMILVPGAHAWTESLNFLLRSGASGPEVISARGLGADGFAARGTVMVEGALPNMNERELIVGETVRARYPEYTVGSMVRFGANQWRVVGIFKTGSFEDSEIWTTREALAREFHSPDNINLVVIDLPDAAAVTQQRQNIKSMPNAKLQVASDPERKEADYKHFGALYTVLGMVVALVFAGTVLSVMMALSLVFSRRTAELSALRALGFKNGAIGRLVLFESNVFALLGATISVVVSVLVLYNRTTYSGSFAFKMLLRPEVFVASIATMVIACSLGAIIPLRRVLALDITEGLREE